LVVLAWFLFARTPRILDRSLLFGWFYLRGAAGYNLLTKYSLLDNKLNNLLTILKFHKDGTIVFKNGYGWLYAYDPDNVTSDNLEVFNTKAQALLNSLPDDVFLKMEVRVEPKLDRQKLTDRVNDLINDEKDPVRLAHLQSIHSYSKTKEMDDIERRYKFLIGISGNVTLEDARIMKEKIEQGVQDKINNLNIICSQIKDTRLLFNFYAGELR